MRFSVTEIESQFADTRMFDVTAYRYVAGPVGTTRVWFDTKPRCQNCSGPLTAMRSSCQHAAAVRRHIAKEQQP